MTQLAARLDAVQAHLQAAGVDGWLLFDFRGSSPFAARIAGVPADTILTRRWWVTVPAEGNPFVTVSAIESGSFPDLGMTRRTYSTRDELVSALGASVAGWRRVAMEYSPNGNVPYVSTVDAGTIDLVRSLGVEVVSSADVLQLLLTWSDGQIAGHRDAAQALTETKDAALRLLRERVAAGARLDEHELQTAMVGELERR
ncbi:MAG: aminopeptidase P family protein, partial [Actinobacteria bacterium]|nr:aminopeptidase P family protein [Actinomycetota bacterium]